MKKLIGALVLVLILVFAMVVPVSAGGNQEFITYQIGTGYLEYKMELGNSNPPEYIGTVAVSSDNDNLYITFNITSSGYAMMENHVAVATGTNIELAKALIPGQPGQFSNKIAVGYWGGSTTYTSPYTQTSGGYTIPLSYFKDGSGNLINSEGWLVISAHTKVALNGSEIGSGWATGMGAPPTSPVPELPAGILLSLGLTGVGGIVWFTRRSRVSASK